MATAIEEIEAQIALLQAGDCFSARTRNERIRAGRMKLARMRGTHQPEEWAALKEEFDYRCVRCGRENCHLDKDHIVPIYQGGSDALDNLQPLCAWCNAGKGPDATNWVEERRLRGWSAYV